MAFVNHIPTTIPGLNHLATVNEKVLKPGLSVAQTAMGYVDLRKEKTNSSHSHSHSRNKHDTVEVQRISSRDALHPKFSTRTEPIDYEYTDEGRVQRQRVQALLASRSMTVGFPADLSQRPNQHNQRIHSKKRPMNRWKISFFSLLLIASAVLIPLAILVAKAGSSTKYCNEKQAKATVTETTTIGDASATVTKMTASAFTTTEVRFKTTTVTSVSEKAVQSEAVVVDPLKDSSAEQISK